MSNVYQPKRKELAKVKFSGKKGLDKCDRLCYNPCKGG